MSAQPTQTTPLLRIQDLSVSYPTPDGLKEVVRGVDLSVSRGERVALVGESGSGKSVTARAVLRLDPEARTSGRILLDGEDVLEMSAREVRRVRGARAGLVFQDPLASLNPVKTVGWQITQPLRIRGVGRREARRRAVDLLGRLGVADAARRFDDYPHQFSGGMRQRVVIAIAVIAEPQVLVADEPTTALDVRVQAQVLGLLGELARERDMAVLLITHDLGIVAGFAQRVAVMRDGGLVEEGDVDGVYTSPRHPYTRALLDAVPRIGDQPGRRLGTATDPAAAPVAVSTEGGQL
ncbi:ABC transporter ATP-binding protein [Nocardiopsis sp. RV163]|uniref:ABC transporter ATP-binding protein n=1 Tax=Nocardiopsis sp. RV163 TaxID=1661388 RepID=UPI00064C38E1|nr:ABC transporter ATP-binding protein [Nocardiopsis sp. RV163]